MKLHQQGFTLTELLVVVVIIGILSAVVLPKFNKVFDTYKTAEAEHMLESVRMDQEARAELESGGGYTTIGLQLVSFPSSTNTFQSNHYVYTLEEDHMKAVPTTASLSYTLQIDYETGVICCAGTECKKLNKDYPSCS